MIKLCFIILYLIVSILFGLFFYSHMMEKPIKQIEWIATFAIGLAWPMVVTLILCEYIRQKLNKNEKKISPKK